MVELEQIAPIVTLAEAQAFARVETGDEEALIAGFIRSASCLCEAFLGQVVVARSFGEQLRPSRDWQRLTTAPVRSIDSVSLNGVAVPATAYATDIDANGCGWIRMLDPNAAGLVEIAGTAGMATGENGVPGLQSLMPSTLQVDGKSGGSEAHCSSSTAIRSWVPGRLR